jgi:hypothetical protein
MELILGGVMQNMKPNQSLEQLLVLQSRHHHLKSRAAIARAAR